VKIWDNATIQRDKTVIVIGPNGSGKTKYGIRLSQMNNADHIGALRNIALQENLPTWTVRQAETAVKNQLNSQKSSYWEISNEIDALFAKLMADDSASAVRYRNSRALGNQPDIETTRIMELQRLWERIFPRRHISFEGYAPRVSSEYMVGEYAARYMSDGERVALYLAARVLDSTAEYIIVDEPEVHFHSKLAAAFWDYLEEQRPKMKFVYITHDLEFALSRNNPVFLMVKPNETPVVVEKASDIPKSTAMDLLAGASLSIFARRIVFCEGTATGSYDFAILSAWFDDRLTALIPLSSCKNVVEAVLAYKRTDIIQNVEVLGIIDQDYRSVQAVDAVKNDVFVLPLHEVESMLLIESVVVRLSVELGRNVSDAQLLFKELSDQTKTVYSKDILNKTASERFKKEIEFSLNYKLRGLKASVDSATQKETHVQAVSSAGGDASALYDQIYSEVTEVFEKPYLDILKILPGKPLLAALSKKLGVEAPVLVGLLCKLVKVSDPEIIASMSQLLPNRVFRETAGPQPSATA